MRLSTSEEVPSTTVGRTGSPGGTNAASTVAVAGTGAYDVTRMREDEFERLTVYIVPDVPCERGTPNRAERTLPRSLALRPSVVLSTPNTPTEGVWSTGVIPRGTRFGPFEGTRTPNKPNDKVSWRYYWRIFKDSDYYYLDGSDTSVANWMRYVASAYSLSVMNLVACQHQEHIYFYTIRDIMPNEELMVWYCKDFATRLGYDIDPERATYSICKEETIKKAYGLPPAPVHPEIAFNHMKYVLGLTNAKELLETDIPSRRRKRLTHCGAQHYEHQLTPNDGSVRSDEGYHSNGYHDEFTPPEDSSDSDVENYVLDCSNKTNEPKETVIVQKMDQDMHRNEYRKVKIKMPRAYQYQNHKDMDCESEKELIIAEEVGNVSPQNLSPPRRDPATSTVIVLESSQNTVVPLNKPYYEDGTVSPTPQPAFMRYTPPDTRILETILTGNRIDTNNNDPNRRQPNATPPPSSPTEMAYSYKKSQRYGNACSPDSSSNLTPLPSLLPLPQQLPTPNATSGCDKKYISASGLRTHWKTTSCKPNNIEEVLAITNAANTECIGTVDKDCHDRAGHEPYEVHSMSQGGLVGAGGARAMVHGEAMLGSHAHTTTPHLAGPGPLSPTHAPPYRTLHGQPPPDHDAPSQHYSSGGETRPSVIESNQPLIIECT
ncbi:unnamed protein product, partial [Iphiclides podalirius]